MAYIFGAVYTAGSWYVFLFFLLICACSGQFFYTQGYICGQFFIYCLAVLLLIIYEYIYACLLESNKNQIDEKEKDIYIPASSSVIFQYMLFLWMSGFCLANTSFVTGTVFILLIPTDVFLSYVCVKRFKKEGHILHQTFLPKRKRNAEICAS